MDSFAISFGSFVLGVVCLVIGMSRISLSAGLITLGVVLVAVAFWPQWRSR